jgi:sugar lactone lactonase YvrE
MGLKIECIVDCGNHLGEGPLWDLQEARLSWLDGTGRRVGKPSLWRLDPRSGKVENWRLARDAGSTVDAEGYLWNAPLISGDLVRYAPDGQVERRIGMPVRNIASVPFGGERLDELHVTSMARVKHPAVHDRFTAEARRRFGAGSLFRVTRLGIRGVPEPRFGA